MDDKQREALRNEIGSLHVEGEEFGACDNLAITLASYFERHMERPAHDPVDDELGWGEWVLKKTNAALDEMVTFVVAREDEQQARIDDLTRQLAEERALVEIRDSLLDGIDAHIAGGEDTVKLVDKIAAMEREADEYKASLLRALRERDEARAMLAERKWNPTEHPQ